MGKENKKTPKDYSLEMAQEIIIAKDEIIQDLEARLDSAYMEQEQMLVELDRNINMMKYHCHQVKANTGEVTQEDIAYCANLINRVMKHKFEYKPKTFEE